MEELELEKKALEWVDRSKLIHYLSSHIWYTHWPDTREFVTPTVELWKRWIRLSCYYNRV